MRRREGAKLGGRLVQLLDGIDGRLGGPEFERPVRRGTSSDGTSTRNLAPAAYLPLIRAGSGTQLAGAGPRFAQTSPATPAITVTLSVTTMASMNLSEWPEGRNGRAAARGDPEPGAENQPAGAASCSHGTQRVPSHQRCQTRPSRPRA